MLIDAMLLIPIFFSSFILTETAFLTVASHMSQLEEPQTKTIIRKSSLYRLTITNQYFLRSIRNCARRWPHPKRRPKQQQDIEGDSDRERRYLLEGLNEEKER
jgi:hypothetical protein